MSAAALLAHRQSSEPYSTQSRMLRDRCNCTIFSGCGRPTEDDTIRGRAKHQLPYEP